MCFRWKISRHVCKNFALQICKKYD